MKLIIAIIVMFVTLASTDRIHRHSHRITTDKNKEDCGKELNIPAAELDNYDLPNVPDTTVGYCFAKCMIEKMGIFHKDTGFKVEVMYNKLSFLNNPLIGEGALLAFIEKCAQEANQIENTCERAYRGAICFQLENQLPKRKVQL